MKKLSKDLKIIKFISCFMSVLVLMVGLGFSYLIAQLNDALGFIFIGTTMTLICISFIYGLSEIIIQLKKNNNLLSEIHKEFISKKK